MSCLKPGLMDNIYICGNGGSAANAIHIANDLHGIMLVVKVQSFLVYE